MFLSGYVLRPGNRCRGWLQSIARLIPLTYLADALRQVMVDGTAFAPLVGRARQCSWAGSSCVSRSLRGSSAGNRSGPSGGLPALLVHELVESLTPACPRRSREIPRIGRIAEREHVLAPVIRGVTERSAGRRHGRTPSRGTNRSRAPRRAASSARRRPRDPTSPTAASWPSRRPRDPASRARSRRRAGDVARVRPHGRRAPGAGPGRGTTMNAQRWRFFEAAGPTTGVEDRAQMVRLQRPRRELADDPARGDRVRDVHQRASPWRVSAASPVIRRTRTAAIAARDRNPPGSASAAESGAYGSASRVAGTASARAAASSGVSGPPRCVARNRATVAR